MAEIPQIDPLKGSMTGGQVTTGQQTQQNPVIQPIKTQQVPNINPNTFQDLVSTMSDKVKANNALMDERNKLITHLYDRPLTQDEISKLSPYVQKAVKSGDRNQIDMQMRIINDQIKGRTSSLDNSVQYLTQNYKDTLAAAEKAKQDAIDNISKFATTYGSNAGQAMRSLYGEDYVNNLKSEFGIDVDTMGTLPPTVAEGKISAQYGTGTTTGSIASAIASQESGGSYDAVNPDSGALGKYQIMPMHLSEIGLTNSQEDQQKFLSSPDLQEQLYQTIISDLNTRYGGNQDKVIAAYYGGDYAAQVVGTPKGDVKQGKYPSINEYVQQVKNKIPLSPSVQGMIDIYTTTGTLPSLSRATKQEREQFYTAIGAGGKALISAAQANKASIAGQTAALRTQQNQYSANQTAIRTLDKQLDLAKKYSDKVSRADSPFVNKYVLFTKGQIQGDAETAAFQNIVTTASNEFAKILSGSAASISGVTVSSAQDAKNLLNASLSKGQFNEILNLMKQESQFRLDSQKDSIDNIKRDIAGEHAESSTGVDTSTIDEDIRQAIKDTSRWQNREQLIDAISQHYGISKDEAGSKVYNIWTDNIKR